MTVVTRCLGHIEGTAGEDEAAPTWGYGSQLAFWVGIVFGEQLPRWQAANAARQRTLLDRAGEVRDYKLSRRLIACELLELGCRRPEIPSALGDYAGAGT